MAHNWYIVQAHSGFEKKVAEAIKDLAAQKELSQYFEDFYVPIETVSEVKKGKKVNVERKFFPGYVMVKMEINEDTWQLVKNTPRVTGFLGGSGNRPQPISQKEADQIFKQVQDGIESPRNTVDYEIGDSVKVTDGPFDTFVGVVEDVDEEKSKLTVAVSIFGRSTPVKLDYTQVEKN